MTTLLVFAIKEEAGRHFDGLPVLFTGIGKVQATMRLTERICRHRPTRVINLGTAGSRKHKTGTLLNITGFIQRDMDVTALGVELYRTPFSDYPAVLSSGTLHTHITTGICATGDSFDIGEKTADADALDMEAYALAFVCKEYDIPFTCIKYISDGADGNAAADWRTSLDIAGRELRKVYNGL